MKKVKIKRKYNSPIIGKKKSLTFAISDDLEQLSKASEKAFCINEVDSNEWSISYINDEILPSYFNIPIDLTVLSRAEYLYYFQEITQYA